MLRLSATLVAMATMRPRSGGWSGEGGVGLALSPAPAPAATRPCALAIEPEPTRAAEPASFLEPGEAPAAGVAAFACPIARRIEAGAEPSAGALQAWSRLSAGPQRR